MSALKNLIKKAGKAVSKAKNVLLPLAGVADGLALPGIGGAIGGAVSKVGGKAGGVIGKISTVTGIGDGKPGVLGIGTGKGILEALKGQKGATGDKGDSGASASGSNQSGGDEPEKKGFSPFLIGGGILAALALARS